MAMVEESSTINHINLRVKTIDDRSYNISIPQNCPINSLKEQIKEICEVAEDRQRLIYRGKVLQDEDTVETYKIQDGHTLHMVIRPLNRPPRSVSEGTATDNQSGNRATSLFESFLSGGGGGEGGGARLLSGLGNAGGDADPSTAVTRLLMMSALGNSMRPTTASPSIMPGGGISPARDGPAVTTPESLEHIRQGILTMHTIMAAHPIPPLRIGNGSLHESFGAAEANIRTDSSTSLSDEQRSTWDINSMGRPKFFVGQWLDAKDTVNQWLEATVMAVAVRPVSEQSRPSPTPSSLHARIERLAQRVRRTELRGRESEDSDNSDISDILRDLRISDEAVDNEVNVIEEDQDVEPIVSVLVHYNGWPARWDEWILPDSPRLAPFRTRTTHPSTQPYSSPTPASNVTGAPSTGSDDLRVVLPQVVDIMNTMQTAFVHLKGLCDDQGIDIGETNDGMNVSQEPSPYASPFIQTPQHDNPRNDSDTLQSQERNQDIVHLSRSIAPLADRFGRLMADLAPHLERLAANPTNSATIPSTTSSPPSPSTSSSPSSPPLENIVGRLPRNLSRFSPRQPSATPAALRANASNGTASRVRPRSPSPSSTFRLLVSSPSQANNNNNNIDIHIHAILTPTRTPVEAPSNTLTSGPLDGIIDEIVAPAEQTMDENNDDNDNDLPELADGNFEYYYDEDDPPPLIYVGPPALDLNGTDEGESNSPIQSTSDVDGETPTQSSLQEHLRPGSTTAAAEQDHESNTLPSTTTTTHEDESSTSMSTISSIVGMFRRMSSRRGSI